jgi:hypothetical protein
MGRPIKKGKRRISGISLKSTDVLERLRARAATTGLGYTDVVRKALDALDAKEPPPARTPEEQARWRADFEAMMAPTWEKVRKLKEEYAARGEPWPGDDHGDMYDEHGLPK